MCWMASVFLMSHSLSSWGLWDGVQSLLLAVLLSIYCHQVRTGTKCWMDVLSIYSFCWEMCRVWFASDWHAVIRTVTRKLCAYLHHSLASFTLCFFIQAILLTHLAFVSPGSFCKPAASLVFLLVQSLRTSVETRKEPNTLLCLFSPLFMCLFVLSLVADILYVLHQQDPGLDPFAFFRQNKKLT